MINCTVLTDDEKQSLREIKERMESAMKSKTDLYFSADEFQLFGRVAMSRFLMLDDHCKYILDHTLDASIAIEL